MSQSKGYQRERELVNAFYDAGFAVTRVPKSGGATKRPLPDILASNQDCTYAIEAKARKKGPIYLTGKEIEELVYFAQNFGAKPRIGARFDREGWYFFHPGELYSTDSGNYRLKKETAIADGTDFAQLVERRAKLTIDDLAPPVNQNEKHRSEVLSAVKDGSLSVEDALELL